MKNVSMYCVKCRKKVNLADPVVRIMKRGRSKVAMQAYSGNCPICGTRVYKFIGRA